MMAADDAVDRLVAARLIGIVRLDDVELAVESARCAIEAGLAAVEVTFTLPGAAVAIARLRGSHPQVLIGAGTVRSDAEMEAAADAGRSVPRRARPQSHAARSRSTAGPDHDSRRDDGFGDRPRAARGR